MGISRVKSLLKQFILKYAHGKGFGQINFSLGSTSLAIQRSMLQLNHYIPRRLGQKMKILEFN